jgi:hypothetical protein
MVSIGLGQVWLSQISASGSYPVNVLAGSATAHGLTVSAALVSGYRLAYLVAAVIVACAVLVTLFFLRPVRPARPAQRITARSAQRAQPRSPIGNLAIRDD